MITTSEIATTPNNIVDELLVIGCDNIEKPFDWFRDHHNLHGVPFYYANGSYSYFIVDTLSNNNLTAVPKELPDYHTAKLECLKEMVFIVGCR
jgi:hypothetical protein